VITPTNYKINDELLQEAINSLPNVDSRLSLNQPNGRFFNDPWQLKTEYKNTVWQKILDSLNEQKGEARLIKLAQGQCYPSHADIDDRWHLSLTGNHSYLIDLDNNTMHKTDECGRWYSMDAGRRHTAANFGSGDRIQLVVRKLLPVPNIANPLNVKITLKEVLSERRFVFDDIISPWLNYAYKKGIVDNFKGEDLKATFVVEKSYFDELKILISSHFNIEIV
jgi:hypothetical protein